MMTTLYVFLLYLLWEVLAEYIFKWCVWHNVKPITATLLSVGLVWILMVGLVHVLSAGTLTWAILWLSIFWIPILYIHIKYPDDFDMDL